MKSIKEKIFSKIRKLGAGYAFSAKDFLNDFKRYEVDVALSTLMKEGTIRRILVGIYDLPGYSELLDMPAAPNIYSVAQALARKFSWRIFPCGNTALNYLGLSTQIPGHIRFLTDGPSRIYYVEGMDMTFTHVTQHELLFPHTESTLVVQALKALGKEHLDNDVIRRLRSRYPIALWKKIASDTSKACGWIHDFIQLVSNEENQYEKNYQT